MSTFFPKHLCSFSYTNPALPSCYWSRDSFIGHSLTEYANSQGFSAGFPPFSNTGGIDTNQQLTQLPPHPFYTSEIEPVYKSVDIDVIVDYFTVTISLSNVRDFVIRKYDPDSLAPIYPSFGCDSKDLALDPIEKVLPHYHASSPDLITIDGESYPAFTLDDNDPVYSPLATDNEAMLMLFLDSLSKVIPDLEYSRQSSGFSGYKYTFNLTRNGVQAGKVAWGGNNETLMVSLSGQGMSLVSGVAYYDFLKPLSPRPTRIDLAHDDYSGNLSLGHWQGYAKRGDFNSGMGCSPGVKTISNDKKSKGDTLYIGNKANGKEICIYEKGKQLGAQSDAWVRVEVRLTNAHRVIPLEVLLNPAAYFLGANKALLRHIKSSVLAEKISIIRKTAELTIEHYKDHVKKSYGQVIRLLLDIGCDMEELAREGMPRRLAKVYFPSVPAVV